MKRIAIIGSGGAGKSTLAIQLGEILGIEVTHLDALHWKPGWTPTPEEEWRALQEQLIQRESWIIDGNYGATLDIRLTAADTIIFLDYPTLVCLYRAFKRRLLYRGRTRPDMGTGCHERIEWSYIKRILDYRREKRPSVMARIEQHSGKRVVILHSPREVKHFLEETRRETP